MPIEDLPEKLEDRIVTTDAFTYMRHNELKPENFDLVPMWAWQYAQGTSSTEGFYEKLYSGMAERMKEKGVVAVTDAIISETAYDVNSRKALMYGTAIVPVKKKEKKDDGVKFP